MSYVSPLAFQDAFLTAFDTFWAGQTPIAYPNVDFDPAKEVGADATAAWVAVRLLGNDDPGTTRYSNSVASDHFSRALTVTFEVFVRQNTSMDIVYARIDDILRFLQKPGVANMLVTKTGSPVEIGPDGTWFQVTLSADLLYYMDRTIN